MLNVGRRDTKTVRSVTDIARCDPGVRICTFAMLHGNEIGVSLYMDAYEMMIKTPLYRHEVKRNLNLAEMERKKYEKMINNLVSSNSYFFAESNDKMDDEIRHLESVFYFQIKQELDRHKTAYSAALARLVEAGIMLSASLNTHDEAIDYISKTGIGYINSEYLRLTSLSSYVAKAVELIPYTGKIVLDTKIITTAYNNLINTMCSAEIIDKTIKE